MVSTTCEKQTNVLNKKQKSLFVKYYPLVDKVVNSMRAKLPAHADLDELHSAGVSGLADAVRRLDPEREESFGGYVSTRIRGAIIDELRDLDYMSRSARADAKNIEKTRSDLEQRFGRTATDEEVRAEIGATRKQFDKIMRRTQAYSFVSLNDAAGNSDDAQTPSFSESIADENATTAREELERKETAAEIRRCVAALPEKQRRVLEGYYFGEKKLGEIAREFGLTEARICQIHSQALSSLRPKFTN